MGISLGLGVSAPATVGAVIAGAYFGDKISPLSDTTNLAPIAAGSELYEHIGHMLWTTIPAILISLLVYYMAGDVSVTGDTIATPEKMQTMLNSFDIMFNWNILLVLPVILVLAGAILKWHALVMMFGASALAVVLGLIFQGFQLTDAFTAIVKGFKVTMIHQKTQGRLWRHSYLGLWQVSI